MFSCLRNSKGMSLVELLIVVVIMGIVVTAIYSVSLTSQKSTAKELEVVDLQDNMRLAMDMISQDIRKAGFLVAVDPVTNAVVDPISNATPSSLRINTACLTKGYGRIVSAPFSATGTDSLTLASADMAAQFHNGDAVRIIRPPMLLQADGIGGSAGDGIFAVTGSAGSTVTISGLHAGVQIIPGDIVVSTQVGAPLINTIDYSQSGRTLTRTINGRSQSVNDITGLSFVYEKDEDDKVKTVTVNLTGSTDPNKKSISVRTLNLTTSVTVRNL